MDINTRITIDEIRRTADTKYIIFAFRKNVNDVDEYYMKIWDREKSEWKQINGEKTVTKIRNGNNIAVGQKSNMVAVEKIMGKLFS